MTTELAERPGIGHNRPPDLAFELRRGRGISCDWRPTRDGGRRPGCFVRYWRIYRDGHLVDSFLKKANAVRRLRTLRQTAFADG